MNEQRIKSILYVKSVQQQQQQQQQQLAQLRTQQRMRAISVIKLLMSLGAIYVIKRLLTVLFFNQARTNKVLPKPSLAFRLLNGDLNLARKL